MAKKFLTPVVMVNLDSDPSNPITGQMYYNTQERTFKAYNGEVWYDVAGPKAILDHVHFTDGGIRTVDYGNYAANTDYVVSMDGGNSATNYSLAINNDTIDGGTA
jgi:hypothetical protein